MRASRSGIVLNDVDAAKVKGMLERGDRQHDIAAWFGVNGGRIAEISTRDTFAHVEANSTDLPPPGPYLSGRNVAATKAKLVSLHSKIVELAAAVKKEIDKL